MFEVDKLSSFFTRLSKNNMGASWWCLMTPMPPVMGALWGASDTPVMPPMSFFSKNKNYLSNQMHSFFPRTKITWGASCAPNDAPHYGGYQGASDTTHPSSTTHNIPHQHTTHPTIPTPPPPPTPSPTHGEKVGP